MTTATGTPAQDLAALVASRICHDLISPLGAIGNGVELLQMSDGGDGSEMTLIVQSVENAQARIRFFRIAFGAAGEEQAIAQSEVMATLAAAARGGRLNYFWEAEGTLSRREVRVAFLVLLCLETAMPYGGDVHIRRAGESCWEITAEAARLRPLPELWAAFAGQAVPVTAAQVQFALAPGMAAAAGRRIAVTMGAERICVTF